MEIVIVKDSMLSGVCRCGRLTACEALLGNADGLIN